MKRLLAISDIHGCYDEFISLLDEVKYNPKKDQLILLGDYVDRGKDSKKVIEKVKHMVENEGAIAIRGNHDDWFLCFLSNPLIHADKYFFESIGGMETINSFLNEKDFLEIINDVEKFALKIRQENPELIRFLLELPYYHETDKHIFVHAGINPMYADWKNNPNEILTWVRDEFIFHPTNLNQKVVFGHTTCKMIHNNDDVFFDTDKIGIDGGCVFGLQLNCLEITDKGYKTYSVPSSKNLQYKQVNSI
jgi:serine/threonine protein phosphatase 1